MHISRNVLAAAFAALTLTACGASTPSATAKDRGGDRSDRWEAARGTQAWFVEESWDHATRLAAATHADLADTLAGSSVNTNGNASVVVLTLADGSELTFNCNMIDTTSRSGTVVKKDVICSAVN